MIDNPELAQSYILLTVLRGQRERVLAKLAAMGELEQALMAAQQYNEDKERQRQQDRAYRAQSFGLLTEELRQAVQRRQSMRAQAEANMRGLRNNLNKIKKLRGQMLAERKQSSQLSQKLQQLSFHEQNLYHSLITASQLCSEKRTELDLLNNQKQIGVKRLTVASDQLRQKVSQLNLSIRVNQKMRQDIVLQGQQLARNHLKQQNTEESIYRLQLEGVRLQPDLQQLHHKINKIKQKLSDMPEMQQIPTQQPRLSSTLEQVLHNCSEISSQTVLLQSQIASLYRHNRHKQHQIQCVQMLMKKLYGCRDRMMQARRSRIGVASSIGASSIGAYSRASQRSQLWNCKSEEQIKMGD